MIDTAVGFYGGLGHNQFRDERTAATRCPLNDQVFFVDDLKPFGYFFGRLPDYHTPLQEARAKGLRTIGVFHSMAWACFVWAAASGLVDFAIVLDAVGLMGVSHNNWPRGVNGIRQPGMLFRAQTTLGITQLPIADGPAIIDIACDHNAIVHNPAVIDEILRQVEAKP